MENKNSTKNSTNLEQLKTYEDIEEKYNEIANKLLDIAKESGQAIEGNVYSHHLRYEVYPPGRSRRINLFHTSKSSKRILEIGFNAGHSCLVFLLSNSHSVIYSLDTFSHKYSNPCFDYLDSLFPGRLIKVPGFSSFTVRDLPRSQGTDGLDFDFSNPNNSINLFHIDGAHDLESVKKDFKNCYRLATQGSIIILDDTNMDHIQNVWYSYLWTGQVKTLEMKELVEPEECRHAIGTVNKIKIALCNLSIGEEYQKTVERGIYTIKRYCETRGYLFCYRTEMIDPSRHVYWDKILMIQKTMKENPEYDYVIWIDSDILILNENIRFEEIIQEYMGDKEMMLARDNGILCNTGVWVCKNTHYNYEILTMIYNQRQFENTRTPEQDAFSHLWTSNVNGLWDKALVLPNYFQHVFNSALYNMEENSLLVHLLGIHDLPLLKRVMDDFYPFQLPSESLESFYKRLLGMRSVRKVNIPNKRIAMCCLTIGKEYGKKMEYGRRTRVDYCNRHGYDYIEDSTMYDPDRPIAWSKILLAKKYVCDPRYDFVWIYDSDTIILNEEIRIEQIILDHLEPGKSILSSRDISSKINTGSVFYKNDRWCISFLDEVYKMTDYINDKYWEQEPWNILYESDALNAKSHITVLPVNLQHVAGNCVVGLIKKGIFASHLFGERNADTVQRMMRDFYPHRREDESEEGYKYRLTWINNFNKE